MPREDRDAAYLWDMLDAAAVAQVSRLALPAFVPAPQAEGLRHDGREAASGSR